MSIYITYLIKRSLAITCFVFGLFILVDFLFNLIGELEDLSLTYTFIKAFNFSLLSIPDRAYAFIEGSCLLGFMIAMGLSQEEGNLNNRKMYWPRGRGWGGSSSINGMIYIRGHPNDYDHWGQLGNTGWSYDDVLPYFKKSESFQGENSSEYHGFDGPLSVKRAKRTDDLLLDKFIEAGSQAGHPSTNDFNGRQQEGVSRYEHTMKGSKRCSASKAYLHPALKRKNRL